MKTFKKAQGVISYEELGESHGDCVVLIHGFPMTHAIWDETLKRLSPHRRYILPDMRGFGESTIPLASGDTLSFLAKDIVDLLDHLSIDRAHIVGASLGAMVAIKIASLQPDRLLSLTVFNTVAQAETPEGNVRRNHQLADVRDRGVENFVNSFARGLFPAGAPASAITTLAGNMARASLPSVIAGLELLRDREDQFASLNAIAAPVLMIAGEHDAGSSPHVMADMADQCPKGELRVVKGAGYMPIVQMPDIAASILEDWLGAHG